MKNFIKRIITDPSTREKYTIDGHRNKKPLKFKKNGKFTKQFESINTDNYRSLRSNRQDNTDSKQLVFPWWRD